MVHRARYLLDQAVHLTMDTRSRKQLSVMMSGEYTHDSRCRQKLTRYQIESKESSLNCSGCSRYIAL